jgi:NAD-dependent DNA ligase
LNADFKFEFLLEFIVVVVVVVVAGMNFAFKNPYTGKVGNVVASLGTSQVGMGTSQIAQPQMGSVNAVEETESDKGGNSTIKLEKPFAGLQFVLSGIENPERADVREKIIALGGEYSGSWTRRSTHLVSAYRKTPKIDQMIGIKCIFLTNFVVIHIVSLNSH